MTQSKLVLVERIQTPVVAPGTLIIFADNNELYMKDDRQRTVKLTGDNSITLGVITADSILAGAAQFGDVAGGNYTERHFERVYCPGYLYLSPL